MRKINLIYLLLACFSFNGYAQNEVEMADSMRSSGKIYVVLTTVLVLLIGLFLYLWSLQKQINQIKKELNNQ